VFGWALLLDPAVAEREARTRGREGGAEAIDA
jgi:hypothetical protein